MMAEGWGEELPEAGGPWISWALVGHDKELGIYSNYSTHEVHEIWHVNICTVLL